MSADDVQKLLAKLHACEEAREWAKGKSLAEIWQSCERGDWLLWLCARMAGEKGWPTKQEVVLAACACARTALRFVPDGEKRPLLAIETAERWAKGEATLREMRTAYAASAYAAADAYAASSAAASGAAYAAASGAYYAAAYAAYAAADAYAAASADAYAAASAAASGAYYAAAYAARANALKECAEIVRQKLHFVAIEDAAVENQREAR